MVKSMTGYGRAAGEINGWQISIEIKALNSRYLDLNFRIPSQYRDKELEIRSKLNAALERGKVDFTLNAEPGADAQNISINKSLVKSYYSELKALSEELNQPTEDLMSIIFRIPNVLSNESQAEDETTWKQIDALIDTAITKLGDFRSEEGANLEKDMVLRITNIQALLKEVEVIEPVRMENMKNKLRLLLEEWNDLEHIDANRLEQELIYYMEKMDITEEKVRLTNHCDYFLKSLEDNSSGIGKKLGFVSQEIGREINTIGSKANHAGIQQLVVQMKDELEKIKEQTANIL